VTDDGTHHVFSPTGEFTVVLPGTWASIPMDDPEAMRRRVAAIVKKQVPRADRLARMRQTVRQELQASATRASELGASIYSIALELLPGVPFAASLIAFSQDWPPVNTPVSGRPADRLQGALPGGELVPCLHSTVLRRSELSPRQVGSTEIEALDLEYWFVTPQDRLLCFLVSVPMCESVELFTAFFDAVADSVRWATPTADSAEAPVATVHGETIAQR
jgi:hypothetical protein